MSIRTCLLGSHEPPIPVAAAWLDSGSPRALNLAQGIPGHPPPPPFLAQLAQASSLPHNASYGPLRGEPSLISAVQAEIGEKYYGAKIHQEEIAITAGANMAFYTILLGICDTGDSVIIPEPWYFNHLYSFSFFPAL